MPLRFASIQKLTPTCTTVVKVAVSLIPGGGGVEARRLRSGHVESAPSLGKRSDIGLMRMNDYAKSVLWQVTTVFIKDGHRKQMD